MSNVYKPRHSINIDSTEQVMHSSKGMVTRPSWNPEDGRARRQEIEEARAQALEEWKEQQDASHPHRVLMDSLAVRLTAVEKELKELKDAQTK